MLNITLLDGKKLQFPGKVNGHEIAKTISPSLAKKALVIKVNDILLVEKGENYCNLGQLL